MLVIAPPRCGATKICMDFSDKLNLPFVGELNPMYIDSCNEVNEKAKYHETLFQPSYSSELYLNALTDHKNYVVLVNQSPHLLVNNADLVILRKDMKNAFLSQANFFIKCRPYLNGEGIIQHLYLSFFSYYGLITYLDKYEKDIVWYEDYFNLKDTCISEIESHKHGKAIMKYIDKMFEQNDSSAILERLIKQNEQS